MSTIEATTKLRLEFFNLLYGEQTGYVMIASMTEADRVANNKKGFVEKGFLWPEQTAQVLGYIDKQAPGRHVWFTPLLYDEPHRRAACVTTANIVWADLEEVHPDTITPSAPIVIQSSGDRYQAVWKLDTLIAATVASEYSLRLAEQYKHLGADTSGADLAQLLRVPGTYNYKTKYADAEGNPPTVKILHAKNITVPVRIFDALPPVKGIDAKIEDMPEQLDADDVAATYSLRLTKTWTELYSIEPPDGSDWSKLLWRFMQLSFEAGMSKQEVFSVSIESKCNKFKRDGYKPHQGLWRDVCRAAAKYDQLMAAHKKFDRDAIELPVLYDPTELSGKESFVDRYFAWATSLGDAASQYHELSAFIVLSGLLAGNLRIETKGFDIFPNIWGMILAGTTTTRKTTAMDHATDLLESVPGCEDVVLGTDGSMEGIFKALSQRPGVPSIFKIDEIQGFMASVGKKDYMAGMLDNLSKLYDGKTLKRQLSKDSVTVKRPAFIIQAGGIKNKMLGMLGQEHVDSGFLPRFMFVTAEGDADAMQPLGPRTDTTNKVEGQLRNELQVLRSAYVEQRPYSAGSQTAMATPENIAHPTQACWDRFFKLEQQLTKAAIGSTDKDTYTPMVTRFSMSTFKCALLLAAARQEPKQEKIVVEAFDLVDAIAYTSKWLPYMVEVLENLGRTAVEADIQKAYKYISDNPGCFASEISRRFNFLSREMITILDTLEGRGMIDIRRNPSGKGKMLWPIA